MNKSDLYKEIYRAIAIYDSTNGRNLKVSSEGIFPENIPSSRRKKCLLQAAEVARVFPGAKVVSYYDWDKDIIVTYAENIQPR